ncbi:CG14946 [Drosophila busckii]|uniref:Short-chain dehydrogenase/reductase 3 n=1 Tax=Drosophila busckii TaxID=30019 RepID=A0A0M4EQQ2_DROBS|nr:short-chain dehydrogenase/reductase family 16C member 6 [Drosophila busckii]ALC39375.1 CG14946 [Drosophila busckii]
MREDEIIHTTMSTKRIFAILQDLVQFLVLFVQVVLEVINTAIHKFLPISQKDISDETVLITGTGHGIGRELALQYAALGCTVVCVDIDEKGNAETVEQAKRLNRGAVHKFTCDVSERLQVLALAVRVREHVGAITVLVNNVGIMPTHPLMQQTEDEIQRVFKVNVFSQFWAVQAFLDHMKEQGRGHIIAISSIAGLVGLSNLVPYCATKFAVRGMMESLHEELREGQQKENIKTTIIYPYMTNTGLCKRPRVKFPSLMSLMEPQHVAKKIVEAHRADAMEASIPSTLIHINNKTRLLPHKCIIWIKDFIDSGVESDLK